MTLVPMAVTVPLKTLARHARRRELAVLPPVASHLSPVWTGRALMMGTLRFLGRVFFSASASSSGSLRLLQLVLAPADLAYSAALHRRREPPLRYRVIGESVESAILAAALRQPATLVTALSSTTAAETTFRFGWFGLPVGSVSPVAAILARRVRFGSWDWSMLVSPVATVIASAGLRQHERGRMTTVRETVVRARHQRVADAARNAKWDSSSEVLSDRDGIIGVVGDQFANVGGKLRTLPHPPEPLLSVAGGVFAKTALAPTGAATVRRVASLWRHTYNHSTPLLAEKVISEVTLNDDGGERWLTERQARELVTSLSAITSRLDPDPAGKSVTLCVEWHGGYSQRMVLSLNGRRFEVAPDVGGPTQLPMSRPLQLVALHGVSVALMEATRMTGLYPLRAVLPGALAHGAVAVAGNTRSPSGGAVTDGTLVWASFAASATHLLGTLTERRRRPVDAMGRARLTSHAMIPWAATIGLTAATTSRRQTVVRLTAGLGVAALLAAPSGRATLRERASGWAFPLFTGLAGAAFQRAVVKLNSELSDALSVDIEAAERHTYASTRVEMASIYRTAAQQAAVIFASEPDDAYRRLLQRRFERVGAAAVRASERWRT